MYVYVRRQKAEEEEEEEEDIVIQYRFAISLQRDCDFAVWLLVHMYLSQVVFTR